jgi:hypothetical protein
MDAPTTSNLIAGVSALVATIALIVAIKAQRDNYRLAVRIANGPGRSHAALMAYAHDANGQPIIRLICVNSPSEMTLRAISLGVTHYERGSFWLAGPSCQFWVKSADNLSLFRWPMRCGGSPRPDAGWSPRRISSGISGIVELC